MKKLALVFAILFMASFFSSCAHADEIPAENPANYSEISDENTNQDLDENSAQNSEETTPEIPAPEIKIAKVRNNSAGEIIEIRNAGASDANLANYKINYLSASGKTATILYIFPDFVLAPNQTFILKNSASNFIDFDNFFAKSLSDSAGTLQILDAQNTIVDQVGWGNSVNYETAPTNLKGIFGRCLADGILRDSDDNSMDFISYGQFSRSDFADCNAPEICEFNAEIFADDTNCVPPCEFNSTLLANDPACVAPPTNNCDGLILSEIGANLSIQFIEVQNSGTNELNLNGCRVMTNRSNTKFFAFANEILPSGAFKTIQISDTDLTLTKTTTGTVYLLNSDGSREIDTINYANLKTDTSFAKTGGTWQQTFATTPNAANVYQEFPPCDDGYYRNLATGKCNKIAEPTVLADCGDGYFRNPATNRCKKITVEAAPAPCPAGQYRNPETNRCKSLIATSTDLQPCTAGYERNPETNRCRKIVANAPAAFAVKTDLGGGNNMWKWLVAGVLLGTTAIVTWQYRIEIGWLAKKIFAKNPDKKLAENAK